MKILIQDYTFNAATKQITFTGYAAVQLSQILLITNTTAGTIIYNFADKLKGGEASGNVLTLAYDTASMNNADELQIYYDDPDAYQPVSLATTIAGEDNDNDAIRTEGTSKELIGSAAATNEDLIPSTEVLLAGFSRFSLQITGTWVGTITIGCSNDNQNFSNAITFNNASTTAGGATSITANGTYFGYINYKYIRVRMTSYTSGTATATLVVTSSPGGQQVIGALAAQSGFWTIHPAIAGSSAVSATNASASSVTILASNTSRRAAYIVNASDKIMYVKFGANASTVSYTKKLAPGDDWPLPTPPIYSGILSAIWEAGPTGSAIVTELT